MKKKEKEKQRTDFDISKGKEKPFCIFDFLSPSLYLYVDLE